MIVKVLDGLTTGLAAGATFGGFILALAVLIFIVVLIGRLLFEYLFP